MQKVIYYLIKSHFDIKQNNISSYFIWIFSICVYCIKNSQLTSEQVNRFQGKYDGKDFSFDYVLLGSMPKLRQSAGTAYKKGNKYVCEDLNGDRVTFDIQKNKVVVSSSGNALSGDYSYMSESTDSDYEVIDWIMENEM